MRNHPKDLKNTLNPEIKVLRKTLNRRLKKPKMPKGKKSLRANHHHHNKDPLLQVQVLRVPDRTISGRLAFSEALAAGNFVLKILDYTYLNFECCLVM